MTYCRWLVVLAMLMPAIAAAQPKVDVLEATTSTGDKVRLLPNGRWEYIDQQKQAQAKQIADQFPENKAKPADAQGGLFGFGRYVMPGDPDYNRGSLNPKLR